MAGDGATRAPDPEVLARQRAALAQVRKLGDPGLRERARPVERFDDALRAEVRRMSGLLVDARGAGLAATQIGVLQRVFVYRAAVGEPPRAMINPEIEWASDEIERFPEGCLSIPGVWLDVERPARVRMRAHDERGEEILVEADGIEASVLQHELDHLDGILILDRVSREERREAMRALREAAAR
jgi:peptide deformylase